MSAVEGAERGLETRATESKNRKAEAQGTPPPQLLHVDRLVGEMGCKRDLALQLGLSQQAALLSLKDSGFKLAEDDPLLLIVPDLSDPRSVEYFSSGNYGLPVGYPGALAWPGEAAPIPGAVPVPGVFAQPRALGTFIQQQLGVIDKSNGNGLLFLVDNFAHLSLIPVALMQSAQFRRRGAAMAALAGVPPDAFLVAAYTLTSMAGPPMFFAGFNGV